MYKTTLKNTHCNFFKKHYNESNNCSWRMIRRWRNFNILNKMKPLRSTCFRVHLWSWPVSFKGTETTGSNVLCAKTDRLRWHHIIPKHENQLCSTKDFHLLYPRLKDTKISMLQWGLWLRKGGCLPHLFSLILLSVCVLLLCVFCLKLVSNDVWV